MDGAPDSETAAAADAGWEHTVDRTVPDDKDGGETLVVDVEGFEGPLDVLLAMARAQKVDLTKISVLALAEQFLTFIAEVRRMRLELAADYLVMAAWLTYLKSRLLLPADPNDEDELSGEEMAAHLAFRLQRLEAMREAAASLMNRKRMERDVFGRGAPEGIRLVKASRFQANVYDLLAAYARQRKRTSVRSITLGKRPVWTIKAARAQLELMLGETPGWSELAHVFQRTPVKPEERRTLIASTLGAALELARDGAIDMRQSDTFAPIYVCRRTDAA